MPDGAGRRGAFLAINGWGDAVVRPLAGDASARRYFRVAGAGRMAVLMDAPPGQPEAKEQFTRIADWLRGAGLSPPAVFAADHQAGLLLLEDLGDALFSRLLHVDPAREAALYEAAVDVVLRVQATEPPAGLPDLSARDWAAAALDPVSEWYAPHAGRGMWTDPVDRLTDLLARHADGPRIVILRDYHAENLLWLGDRSGLARVGLLDFQDAQMGQPGYDLVSLCQDARRDVSLVTEGVLLRRFAAATGANLGVIEAANAVLGAQRALRILGIFARLCIRDGKAGYLDLMPRVWGLLQRNLAHPTLASLAPLLSDLVPEPSPAFRQTIRSRCAR